MTSTARKRIVVLISGNGRNLQAIIDACANNSINGDIVGVISNKADAYGLIRARQASIPTCIIPHQEFADRESFDAAIQDQIDLLDADLVVLAGFMRILTDDFVRHYLGRMINIHPSLLPKYPGLNTHQRALDAGDATHGATVHFVTPELDAGPTVLQHSLTINTDDTAESLAERVMEEIELALYPKAVALFCDNVVTLSDTAPYRTLNTPET
ncbi:MAG: phosphoribosylglycinamide formyltransferase [Gammaproteobacteria bacterium]|nr:phosphoribosylglycinamide formyltransferase [Gammaproteobacteria bacterium]